MRVIAGQTGMGVAVSKVIDLKTRQPVDVAILERLERIERLMREIKKLASLDRSDLPNPVPRHPQAKGRY